MPSLIKIPAAHVPQARDLQPATDLEAPGSPEGGPSPPIHDRQGHLGTDFCAQVLSGVKERVQQWTKL